ncbi:MAG: beta strand repeat-containing protein [Massilia sp.]
MWLSLATMLSACGGGGGTVGLPTGQALFTSAPATITLAAGASAAYTIGGGNPLYTASSSNRDVATVTASGTSFTVTGVSNGTVTITITDAVGASVSVTATVSGGTPPASVNLFSTAPADITLAVGASVQYTVGGGKPAYAASSSNPAVVAVTVSGTAINITGLAAGNAQIFVTDTAGTSLTLAVTIGTGGGGTPVALFVTAPSAVTLAVGSSTQYTVGGGKPAYAAASSNPSVVTATASGTALTLNALAAGTAQVLVTDATGTTVSLAITVGNGGVTVPVALFTTAPSSLTYTVGTTGLYSIVGGTPGYAAASSNPAVLRATNSGSTLQITALAPGAATVIVTDSVGGTTSFSVTVSGPNAAPPLFVTAPGAVTLTVGASASYAVGGGTPAYAAASSNPSVASVTLNGTAFVINGLASGTALINVTDATGTAVTLAVTVGNGGVPVVPAALFITAPSAVTVAAGATAQFSIGGGLPPYTVTSSDQAVAKVAIDDSNFVVTGIAAGSAQISVSDAAGASQRFTVSVGAASLYVTAPSTLTVAVGGADSFLIGGGKPPYTSSSSNSTVLGTGVSGNVITLTGRAAGTAQALFFDSVGAFVTVDVTVGGPGGGGNTPTALYTTAPTPLTMAPSTSAGYTIGGGTGPYVATSNDVTVVTASVSGQTLTLTSLASGSARVTVFDAVGAQTFIDLTVTSTPVTPVTLLPSTAAGNVGDALRFLVSGGVPGYTITMTNPSIASVSPSTVASSGGSFTINLLNVGTTTAHIVDSRGQATALPITVDQTSTVLRLSPSELVVAENSTDPVVLNIYGGTGPYRAFTSDQTLSNVSVTGSTLTVALGSKGNRCINPIDQSGTYIPNGTFDVTITAVDSLGASATSTFTIKDNGAGLNLLCP